MKRAMRDTGLMLLITLILLLGLEAMARVYEVFYPPKPVDIALGFGEKTQLFTPDPENPDFMRTNPAKCRSFKPQRFPAEKPKGGLRICMLGGSSINYLGPDLLDLRPRLQEAFSDRYSPVETINAGGLAYGSQRLVPIMAEVLSYAPDVILLYSAHNEFEEVQQLQYVRLKTVPLQQFLSHSALFRCLREVKGAWSIRREQEEHARRLLENPEVDYLQVEQHEFMREELSMRMQAYENNLSMMIELCQDQGVPLIIGTVPSNLWRPRLPKAEAEVAKRIEALYAAGDYAQGKALAQKILQEVPRRQSSDLENGIIRRLAAHYNLILADVESAVCAAEAHGVPGERLIADECHLNAEGSAILIDTFFQKIVGLL